MASIHRLFASFSPSPGTEVTSSPVSFNFLVSAQDFLRFIRRTYGLHMLRIALGDYNLLEFLIETEIRSLLGVCEKLCFVVNRMGAARPMSPLTVWKRRLEITEQQHLVSACQNGYSKKCLPLPVLSEILLSDIVQDLSKKYFSEKLVLHINTTFPDTEYCLSRMCQNRLACEDSEKWIILADDR